MVNVKTFLGATVCVAFGRDIEGESLLQTLRNPHSKKTLNEVVSDTPEVFNQFSKKYPVMWKSVLLQHASTPLSDIGDKVLELMNSTLQSGHDADVALASQLQADFDGCNNGYTALQPTINSLTQHLSSARNGHQQCRKEQAALPVNACPDFIAYKATNWNSPPENIAIPDGSCFLPNSLIGQDSKAQAESYIAEDFLQWQLESWGQFSQLKQACANVTTLQSNTVADCLLKQNQFELEACTLYTFESVRCTERTTCLTAFDTSVAQCDSIQEREVARKEVCSQSEEIVCILHSLFGENTQLDWAQVSSSAVSEVIANCSSKPEHLQRCNSYAITCPFAPTPPSCSVPTRPNETSWWLSEYSTEQGKLFNNLSTVDVHVADLRVLVCPDMGGHEDVVCSQNQRQVCGTHVNSSDQCTCIDCPPAHPFGSPAGCTATAPTPAPTPGISVTPSFLTEATDTNACTGKGLNGKGTSWSPIYRTASCDGPVKGGGWEKVLEFQDDWCVDDYPNTVDEIKAGFASTNGAFIGQQKLHNLIQQNSSYTKVLMCFRASRSQCTTGCAVLSASDWLPSMDNGWCSEFSNASKLERIILTLSGSCQPKCSGYTMFNVGDGSNKVAVLTKDGLDVATCTSQNTKFWSYGCGVSWRNAFHVEGYGLTLQIQGKDDDDSNAPGLSDDRGFYELGRLLPSSSCSSAQVDVDSMYVYLGTSESTANWDTDIEPIASV